MPPASIAERAYGLPEDVRKAVDEAESLVFDIARHEGEGSTAPIKDLLNESLERLEELYERAASHHGHAHRLPRPRRDDLGAAARRVDRRRRPAAMGKTSFALGMATHAALRANRPVLVFSLEMSKVELSQRMLCSEARVDSNQVRNGKLTEGDWSAIANAIGRLAEAKIWIDDNPNVNVMEIRSKARRLRSEVGDLGMVVVDYIQLMTGRSHAESRQVEVSEISRGLKLLARELECPVVALAQLNRGLEQRADKRPMLSRPARVRGARAGRRRRHVHLPRRGLRPEAGEPGLVGDPGRQAPQRPHRCRPPVLPGPHHPFREHGP